DLHAVEIITLGIVPRGVAVAGDLAPRVRFQSDLSRDDERRAVSHDPAIVFSHELSIRIVVDLSSDHARRKRGIGRVDTASQLNNLRNVIQSRPAHDQLWFRNSGATCFTRLYFSAQTRSSRLVYCCF